MPKAASRNVKKGEALLGVITYDKWVSVVAHVAAQGLPGICADPRIGEKERLKRAAEMPGGYTKTNIPVAIVFQGFARGNMQHFMHSAAFLLIANHHLLEHSNRTSAQVYRARFLDPRCEENRAARRAEMACTAAS